MNLFAIYLVDLLMGNTPFLFHSIHAEFRYRGSALRIQDWKYTTFLSPGGVTWLSLNFFLSSSLFRFSPILGRFDQAAYFHLYVSTMNFIPLGEGLFF